MQSRFIKSWNTILSPVVPHRVSGVDDQRRPDHEEADDLGFEEGFIEQKNSHEKHAAGRYVLQDAHGGQLQPSGAETEKKQRHGRYHG